MRMEAIKDAAETALERREFEAAVAAASELIAAGEPWLIDGLVRRSLALENWEEGPTDRFLKAAQDWQKLIDIAPASIAYRGLARVLLKSGDRDSAHANLLHAERAEATPEVMLGLAHYYRTASPPDLQNAKAYYFRAALRGRTQGVRGFVEVAYELDQPYAAAAMTLVGLLATPMLALFLRDRRHAGF